MRLLNEAGAWWGIARPSQLSIVDLIANDSIDAEVAAALWWMLEQGASLVVAALPQGAGKTTLATTLLSFLPDDAAAYVTSGPFDPVQPPAHEGPLYLLINEISDHLPVYLFGPGLQRAAALIEGGTRAIATVHAPSAEGVVLMLRHEAGLPDAVTGRFALAVVIHVTRTESGVARRVSEVGLIEQSAHGPVARLIAAIPVGKAAVHALLLPEAAAVLARWSGLDEATVQAAISSRSRYLVDTGRRGVHTQQDVAAAIRHFRRQEQR